MLSWFKPERSTPRRSVNKVDRRLVRRTSRSRAAPVVFQLPTAFGRDRVNACAIGFGSRQARIQPARPRRARRVHGCMCDAADDPFVIECGGKGDALNRRLPTQDPRLGRAKSDRCGAGCPTAVRDMWAPAVEAGLRVESFTTTRPAGVDDTQAAKGGTGGSNNGCRLTGRFSRLARVRQGLEIIRGFTPTMPLAGRGGGPWPWWEGTRRSVPRRLSSAGGV